MKNKIINRLFPELFNDKKDAIVFLVGCFSTFYIDFVGRVYVGELIIFLLYLFYPKTRKEMPRGVKKLWLLIFLWLVSAIVTDFYRDTPLIDTIKGFVSELFLMALVPFACWALRDKISRIFVFYLGSVVSTQLTYYLIFSQTEFGSTEIWETYSYLAVLKGLAIYIYWRGNHRLSYLLFLIIGFFALSGGSRNAFLICLVSVIILYNIDVTMAKNKHENQGDIHSFIIGSYQKKLVRLVFALLIGLFVISNAYEYMASNGFLGEEAYVKYTNQKDSDLGLSIGRMGTIMDIDLIMDSPIIGYGSYAKDYTGYVENFYLKHNVPYQSDRFDIDVDSVENMLPRHSRMFGMWMWHGIGAGIFWIYIFLLFFKTIKNGCVLLEPKLLGYSIYTLFAESWANLFSVMAERLPPIFFWVFLILINEQYKQLYGNKKGKPLPVNSNSQL